MKLRHFLFFIALIVIVILAYNQFHQVQSIRQLLSQVRWWILIFVLPVRYLYYRSNAKYFESFFAIFKQKTQFGKLTEATITMNFVNIVFPSGGLSGLSYIRKALDGKIDSSNITLAQLSWYMLSFIAYLLFLFGAFVLLLMSNQVIQISSRLVLLVLFIVITVSIAILMFIFSPNLVASIAVVAAKPVNRVLVLIRRRVFGKERIRRFLEQIHESVLFLRSHRSQLGKPFLYTCLMIFWDLATIYIVFLAFGTVVNPGLIMAGYVIALISSLAAVVTAGIGVYEAAMVATFVGLNVPFDIAFAVTIIYRLISLWLFVPVGLIFYKRTLLDTKPKLKKQKVTKI